MKIAASLVVLIAIGAGAARADDAAPARQAATVERLQVTASGPQPTKKTKVADEQLQVTATRSQPTKKTKVVDEQLQVTATGPVRQQPPHKNTKVSDAQPQITATGPVPQQRPHKNAKLAEARITPTRLHPTKKTNVADEQLPVTAIGPMPQLQSHKNTKVADEQPTLPGRQIPGQEKIYPPPPPTQSNPGAVMAPSPEAFPTDQIPIPDRWRLIDVLSGSPIANWYDPYNQNALKADRPLFDTQDWFFNMTLISDSLVEPRAFPLPTGIQTTQRSGSNDIFGHTDSLALSQTFIASASLINGSTAFKPPDLEIRLTLAFNLNYAQTPERTILSINPSNYPNRFDNFLGVQEAFIDYHIRNVSERYDFDSIRVGIQPFSTDFRGFLFQDDQLGVRLFGDRDDNRYQYNLAFFDRLEKDTNSGLNSIEQQPRKDYVAVANLYRQDLPVPGFTSQVTVVYNANRQGNSIVFDKNGFPVVPALIGDDRPRNYDVVYLGYNGDGHIDEFNLTTSFYYALGQDRNNIFTNRPADIRSFFVAAEPSYDLDWMRFKLSGLFASGNSDPRSNTEHGFDAILEDPQFAGADASYWIRQAIPLIAGSSVVFLSSRNGVLADLRTSKTQGQSNFNNPGTVLVGAGADFDVLPELRVSTNINHLWFADTEVLEILRQQANISNDIGWDLSVSSDYRPWQTQNVVFRVSGAYLVPGSGLQDLFSTSQGKFYSVLFNMVLTY